MQNVELKWQMST